MVKKMKGDMIDIFATLVFIGLAIGLAFFLRAYFISYDYAITPLENLEALEMAYAIESCFQSLGGEIYITSDFLDKEKGKSLAEICNIIYPPIYLKITDTENNKEWEFGSRISTFTDLNNFYDKLSKSILFPLDFPLDFLKSLWWKKREKSKPTHEIFVPIMYKKISDFKNDDTIFESGKYYVIVYSKKNGVLNIDIYPIERYEGDIDNLQNSQKIEIIKNENDMKNFATNVKSISEGSEKIVIMIEYFRRRIKFEEFKEYFGENVITEYYGPGEKSEKIMYYINLYTPEIHGGRLYVEI
ncbi:MAG: hypothetical protein QW051_03440 [Candidatus Aenigmatarchaeota archaeon]